MGQRPSTWDRASELSLRSSGKSPSFVPEGTDVKFLHLFTDKTKAATSSLCAQPYPPRTGNQKPHALGLQG
ncbi:hypothetical protein Taro_028556 [Colocasia esculenta]|uniref:Uncharacterized protein n=1 Tax=Colocasia esculenta TaxID=4460 RepID=A0A843VLE5_COLES|nr:hypothetical protein [Colocasia esculenta]